MTANQVQEAIQALLAATFPQVTLAKRGETPVGPALVLGYLHRQPEDVNASTVAHTLEVKGNYIPPADPAQSIAPAGGEELCRQLVEQFPLGRLAVGKRLVPITITGGTGEQPDSLTLLATWWAERPAGAPPVPMQEITLVMRGKE